MSKYIYLCGQITGLSYEEARYGWRKQVVEALAGTDITCLSPMRAKAHLQGIPELSKMGNPEHVLSTPKAITTRDRFDVMRSDILFANFCGMDRVSAGSMIEFGWADAYRKPILCCMEEGNAHEHAIASELVGWRCYTLAEGIAVVRAVLAEGL